MCHELNTHIILQIVEILRCLFDLMVNQIKSLLCIVLNVDPFVIPKISMESNKQMENEKSFN